VSPWRPVVLRRSLLHLARIWHGRWLLAVEQGAGHDDALDLVGAFVDLGDFSRVHIDHAIGCEN
jgi:hypothetical protein